jgi:hypothetical protein
VIQISAAIIFLGGLFAGGWNIAQGVKQVRKSNKNKAQREQQV